jgi:hypothetical protein
MRAICNLAAGSVGVKQQVAAAPGALRGLVQALRRSSLLLGQEVAEQAAEALMNLAADSVGVKQQAVAAPGALRGLVQVLRTSSHEVAAQAAGA